MRMSNSQMKARSKSSDILNDALYLVDKVKVHQDICRDVVNFAFQPNAILYNDEDWIRIMQELNNSVREWAELSSLESLLKCDIIAGKIASLRTAISDFCGIPHPAAGFTNDMLSNANSLVPTILDMFSAPDALDAFDALPSAHSDTAVSLLRRVLASLPAENRSLIELISGSIRRLESREVNINFDLPDLSTEVKLVQSQPVSSGQFGDVYLAKHGESDLVTVRVLKHVSPVDTRAYKALGGDLKLRMSLRHPNLLPFYGICSTNLGTCMISPYMENGSATVYLECHPEANAISLLAGTANGLHYLHSCWPSITHGDVRGANILVTSRGEALLADHDLGKIIEEQPNTPLPYAALGSMNAKINVAGIRWAAPEIVCREEDIRRNASSPVSRDERVTFWRDKLNGHVPGEDALIEVVTPMSDVWSFGMTVYELLTGRNPYHQHARLETVILAISLNERPLAPNSQEEVRPEWQPELWSLMLECWCMERRQRPTMDTISKRTAIILGKSMVTHSSLERARSIRSFGHRESPTLSRAHSHSILRALSPTSPPSLPPSQMACSTSYPSLSSPISAPTPRTSSSNTNHSTASPSVLPTRSPSRNRSVNSVHQSRRKGTPSYPRPPSGSSRASGETEGRNENLHPLNVTIAGNKVEWSKMSVTQRRAFILSCQSEGSASAPSRAHSPMQSLPSSSPPRSLSPGSSRSGHRRKNPGEVRNVIIPIRASPLTAEAISLPSKLELRQLSKIIIPVSNEFTQSQAGLPRAQPASAMDSNSDNGTSQFRSQASAPLSVYSVTSHTSYFSAEDEALYVPGERSFDIINEDEDDSTLDARNVERIDVISSPSNESSEMSTSLMRHWHQTSDWMSEAFARVSLVSGAKPNGHVPEDVLSNSSDSRHSVSDPLFPPGLNVVINETDLRPLSQALPLCAGLIEELMKEEAEFISTRLDPGILQWVGQSEGALIPLMMAQQAEKGIRDAYSSITTAHRDLRESLIPSVDLCSLEKYSEIFEQYRQGLSTLQPVYQDYVEALSNLNDILTNALDGEFNKLYQTNAERCSLLSDKLRQPFFRLKSYATCLKDIVKSLSRFAPHEEGTSWEQVTVDWNNFSHQIRLLSWQASLSRDSLVSFDLDDLYPGTAVDPDEASRHKIQLRIIEGQSKFVGEAKSAGKRLEPLLRQASVPVNPMEVSDKLSEIYRLQMGLLNDLYSYQRQHHPSIPTVVSMLLDATIKWGEAYSTYSKILVSMLRSPDILSLQRDGAVTPMNLQEFLASPFDHLRGILRHAKALFDVTADQHTDLEPIKALIQSLSTLIKDSYGAFGSSKFDEEIESLKDLLSWNGGTPPASINFSHESRHIIHKGILHYPLDPSGTRVSIDDRGSSIEVFLVLLDNCLLVTEPRIRHGVERLGVKGVLHLDDLFLPDSEATRASQQQIFLLDSTEGKKVASPVLLRYRDTSTPRTAVPRPRKASASGVLGLRVEDGMHLLYPKELLLLANSSSESTEWRSHLSDAKLKLDESGIVPVASKSMFKLVPTAALPFEPTSTAEFYADGEKTFLVCAENGIFVQKGNDDLVPCVTTIQSKQCCVIDEMRTALVLVGKSLWALKLEDLLQSETLQPVVIKSNASIFRVGYQRGQLLLAVACEAAKHTVVKWYTPSSRMSRPSFSLSSGIFGRSKKPFRLLGEQEISGAIHGLDILDSGIMAMGVTGFHLLLTDQGQVGKCQELPQIRAGASSEAAQRCRTSKAIGAIHCDDQILLCYSDFGVYVSTAGDIVGRAIDWTSPRISTVSFVAPYFFLLTEDHIEVRLVENGRKLEIIEGEGFKLLHEVHGVHMSATVSPGGIDRDSTLGIGRDRLDNDSGLLHLAMRRKGSESTVELVELQMEVLDLAP